MSGATAWLLALTVVVTGIVVGSALSKWLDVLHVRETRRQLPPRQ